MCHMLTQSTVHRVTVTLQTLCVQRDRDTVPHADTQHCAQGHVNAADIMCAAWPWKCATCWHTALCKGHVNAADIMCAERKSSGRTANRDERADGTTETLLTAVHGLRWEARQCGHSTIILQSATRQNKCISNEFQTPFNSRTKKTFYSQILKHFKKTVDKWLGALHCLRQYQGRSVDGDEDDDNMTFGCWSWRWYWRQLRFELELPHALLNNFEHEFRFK
jgi:hypothetical protein